MRITFRKSYEQDIRLFRDGAQAAWYLGFLAVALLMPLLVDGYYLTNSVSFTLRHCWSGPDDPYRLLGTSQFRPRGLCRYRAYAHTIMMTRYGVPWLLSVPWPR